jgi:hypothetical protein
MEYDVSGQGIIFLRFEKMKAVFFIQIINFQPAGENILSLFRIFFYKFINIMFIIYFAKNFSIISSIVSIPEYHQIHPPQQQHFMFLYEFLKLIGGKGSGT